MSSFSTTSSSSSWFVEGLRAAAFDIAKNMDIHQIPLDYDQDTEDRSSIVAAIESIKKTGYRYIFGIVFTRDTHDALLEEAYNQGVAGTGLHNWLFADSFGGNLDGRTFPENSPLHLSYKGAAKIEVSGGVKGMPSYDNYNVNMAKLRNTADLEYLGNLFPNYFGHENYGDSVPFVNDENFLVDIKNGMSFNLYEFFVYMGR